MYSLIVWCALIRILCGVLNSDTLASLDDAVCSTFDTSGGTFSVLHNTTSRPTQGTTVHVTCDTGKQAREGATSATCATDGSWVPAMPGCGGKYDV